MKKAIYSIIIVCIMAGAILLVLHRNREIKNQIPRRLSLEEVRSTRVEFGNFSIRRHYIGSIEPEESAIIISRVQAMVTRVLKHEGDKVKKGDLLIELDSEEGNRESLKRRLSLLINQKEYSKKIISNLRDVLHRDKILYENGGISKEQLQISENRLLEAETKLQAIKIQMEEIKNLLRFYSIKAPYDGIVAEVYVQEGDTVLLGKPLIKIESNSNYRIMVLVDSDSIRHIKRGFYALVKYKEKSISTRVDRVYPSVGKGVGTVELRLNKRPFGLPSGAYVDVLLETKRLEDVYIVPEDSLLFNGNTAILYKLNNKNQVEGIKVTLIGMSNKMVAIKGKLKPDDRVIRADQSTLLKLTNGTKVKVINEKTDI